MKGKGFLKGFSLGVMISALTIFLIGTALASSGTQSISVLYSDIKIVLDGKPLTPTDANGNVVEPFSHNGTTYLPVRAIANAFGKEVSWDGNTSTVTIGTSAPVSTAYSGNLGDYYVSIDSVKMAKDYQGKPAVIVTYTWTNNSEETASFAWTFNTQVFQDGIECDTAILTQGIDSTSSIKDIKPGATLAVQCAYSVTDTSQITVEVSELFDFSDSPAMLTRTFNLE